MAKATLPIDYTICQIQQDKVSLVVNSDRYEGMEPEWDIDVQKFGVVMRLNNLDFGTSDVIPRGKARANHVDWYIRTDELRKLRHSLPIPTTTSDPSSRLPIANSVGHERYAGIKVKMISPISCHTVKAVVISSAHSPSFVAEVENTRLHIDFEGTPRKKFPKGTTSIHFGISGEYEIKYNVARENFCEIHLTHEQYATIHEDIMYI